MYVKWSCLIKRKNGASTAVRLSTAAQDPRRTVSSSTLSKPLERVRYCATTQRTKITFTRTKASFPRPRACGEHHLVAAFLNPCVEFERPSDNFPPPRFIDSKKEAMSIKRTAEKTKRRKVGRQGALHKGSNCISGPPSC